MAMGSGTDVPADVGEWVKHIVHENELAVKIAATAIVVWVLWQILFKSFVSGSESKFKLPPGPLNLPLVGAMLSIESDIWEWYRKTARKYGKIFYFRLGSHGVVVVSSVAGAEEVFKTKDAIFANKPNNSLLKTITKYVGFDGEDIGTDSYTERQRALKKLLVNHFLSVSELDRFAYVRTREGACMVESVQGQIKAGRTVEVGRILSNHAINVMSLLVSRRRYTDALTSESDELKHCDIMIKKYADLFFKLNLGDLFPCLAWADIQGLNKQYTAYQQLACKVIDQVVEEHKEVRRRNKNRLDEDFVDILLTRQEEGKLSDNAIRGVILDVFAGGADTHANTAEWALLELVKHPDCLAKLQREIDEVVGKDRPAEESDYPNMPYLQAVIQETFRFHGAVPAFLRFTLEATTVQGFHIPANTSVLVHAKLISEDAEYWDHPEKFDPERFLNGEKIDIKAGLVFSLTPFGSGRRRCPGVILGHLLLQRDICTLVHAFDWSPPPGKTKEDIDNKEDINGLSRPEIPLLLSAKPRLDLSVYTNLIN